MATTIEKMIGKKAPDFALEGEHGPIKLGDFKGKKVVLYFYPRDMTPGCTTTRIRIWRKSWFWDLQTL